MAMYSIQAAVTIQNSEIISQTVFMYVLIVVTVKNTPYTTLLD